MSIELPHTLPPRKSRPESYNTILSINGEIQWAQLEADNHFHSVCGVYKPFYLCAITISLVFNSYVVRFYFVCLREHVLNSYSHRSQFKYLFCFDASVFSLSFSTFSNKNNNNNALQCSDS